MLSVLAIASVASCNKEGGDENTTPEVTKLLASPKTVDFSWKDPAPQTITVVCNAADGYTVGQTAEWYTAVADGKNLTITAQTNTGEARSHSLVLSAKGADDLAITVNQEAGGVAKELSYNFTTAGPYDIGWPTLNFIGEFTDNIQAGDGWGHTGGHFYAALDGVGSQDRKAPYYRDIYGKAYDADGKEVDWLYNISYTDNDNGKYTGEGGEYKIYIEYKANTTGAPRYAKVCLYFDDTDEYKVVGTYDNEGNYKQITCKEPIFSFEVTQPAA